MVHVGNVPLIKTIHNKGKQRVRLKIGEIIERAKKNLRHARVESKFNSAAGLAEYLRKYDISVSRSSISRWEKPEEGTPDLEYIIGMHWHTGIPISVLIGLDEWGNGEAVFTKDDPEAVEILRLFKGLSPKLREVAETQLYAIYLHDNPDKAPDE